MPAAANTKPAPYFGTAPTALLTGLAGLADIEVHVVSCIREPVRSPAKLAENTWFHSLHVPKIGWMRTAYQGCIRAVRKKLKELQPDIVHGQGTELDCALDAVFSGFPNVVTIHGNMRAIARALGVRPFSFGWLAARLEGITLPRSDGVVCITRHAQAQVRGLAKRTWLVPNAVDAFFFDILAHPVSALPPSILCVGTIYPLKNQNRLIKALDVVARSFDFRLVFLGATGEEEHYVEEFRRLVGTRSWCVYDGFADRDALRSRLAEASLLVLPSIEDNCPMVLLEAMAAGVPVVAARVGGVPDLIEEGRTGLLCDPLDQASIGAAVGQVLRFTEAARTMADLAKVRARERFHPAVIARRHVEIYRGLLEEVTQRRP